jgi:Flp pilus assembly protein TadD
LNRQKHGGRPPRHGQNPALLALQQRQARQRSEADIERFHKIHQLAENTDVLAWLVAHEQYTKLLERPGTHPEIAVACLFELINLNTLLRSLDRDRFSKAAQIEYAEAIVRLRPRDASGLLNLGQFYSSVGRSEEALAAATKAVAIQPARVGGWTLMARCYLQLGEREHAQQCLAREVQVPVTSDRDALNHGIACLTMGDYAQGWPSFRNRFAGAPELRAGVAHLVGRYPTWTGEPMTGRLLLHSYGGAGDAFMLVRWVPMVRARVWDLTLEVSDYLVPFMAGQFEDVEVRAWGHHHQTGQHYDAWQESFALPALCGCRSPKDVPPAPYLRTTVTRDPLPGTFKVGIAWAGNPANPDDALRSTRLADWAPVFGVPGVSFYGLQVSANPASKQLAEASVPIHDLGPELRDWEATAATLMELDLVIAVDCSVAHLAGALGRPVWICLSAAPEWRWMLERTDTPWYGKARLFRQLRVGEWAIVFAEVAAELRQLVAAEQV